MTQEYKQLLLTDLCGRLPYGVMCKINNRCVKVEEINPFEGVMTYDGWLSCGIDEDIKPYLRPMSSMTENERDECYGRTMTIDIVKTSKQVIDWLNKNMFDYRGLIPKGLALEAPEGMYNN